MELTKLLLMLFILLTWRLVLWFLLFFNMHCFIVCNWATWSWAWSWSSNHK